MDAIAEDTDDRGSMEMGRPAYVHTLSVRLTNHEYRRLRRFVAMQEDKLGRRLTHQAVLEAALYQFLERNNVSRSNPA